MEVTESSLASALESFYVNVDGPTGRFHGRLSDADETAEALYATLDRMAALRDAEPAAEAIEYDLLPDLALLLGAALRAGRDGSEHAKRIAERLELDPDCSTAAVERVLREALGRPVRCEPRSPDHAREAVEALSASVWQRQQWGEHGSKDDLRSAAWELERAKVHALLGIEAAVSRLAARWTAT